jgi:CheY-like chemotaxis protein
VEAADNVVHAYDMNMGLGVSDSPPSPPDEEEDGPGADLVSAPVSTHPSFGGTPSTSGRKRSGSSLDHREKAYKIPRRTSQDSHSTMSHSRRASKDDTLGGSHDDRSPTLAHHPEGLHVPTEHSIAPGVRLVNIRDVMSLIVNDVLKVGGRPESAIAQQVDGGEEIEVHNRNADGTERMKVVKWHVDSSVPESILVDERDLAGMISRVFHNAVKFTDTGEIIIHARLSPKGRYILVNVRDTGSGIPKAFVPQLFKAFAKEDDAINRQSEGLGLGLMVAKGMARRLNGDLYHIQSETDGPTRGTEFEMRVPLNPTEVISRPGTPYSSPSPSVAARSDDAAMSPDRLGPSRLSPRAKNSPTVRDHTISMSHRRSVSNSGFVRFSRPHDASSGPKMAQSEHLLSDSVTSQPRPPLTSSQSATIPKISNHTPLFRPVAHRRHTERLPSPNRTFDRNMSSKLPLSFLVVEDNWINRKLLVGMLKNLGYETILTAYDGVDAVRQMHEHRRRFVAGEVSYEIDVVLMDIWMPKMDGYEAALRIQRGAARSGCRNLAMQNGSGVGPTDSMPAGGPVGSVDVDGDDFGGWKLPVIMAITADVTDEAWERAARVGMKGPLSKPHTCLDLERSLWEWCNINDNETVINNSIAPALAIQSHDGDAMVL